MENIALLRLLQIADSQIPIGSAPHSFGLETLAADESLTVDDLAQFLEGYLEESGGRDAAYCRAAHSLAILPTEEFSREWLTLNQRLSALQPARESRTASATLGRRFLQLAANLSRQARLADALKTAKETQTDVHHATAFGLVGSLLGLTEEETALTYLQQNITALISAGQRLLPLGQARASALLWHLHPCLIRASANGTEDSSSWIPMLDIASMRHPGLMTRLFIS